MNIILASDAFEPYFLNHLYIVIKQTGVESTKTTLLSQGYHPAVVQAVVKKVQRKWGW